MLLGRSRWYIKTNIPILTRVRRAACLPSFFFFFLFSFGETVFLDDIGWLDQELAMSTRQALCLLSAGLQTCTAILHLSNYIIILLLLEINKFIHLFFIPKAVSPSSSPPLPFPSLPPIPFPSLPPILPQSILPVFLFRKKQASHGCQQSIACKVKVGLSSPLIFRLCKTTQYEE